MPITGSANVALETFPCVEALPADAARMLGRSESLFGTKPWWSVVQDHAIPAPAQAVFALVRLHGQAAAILPLIAHGRRLHSLTTPYSCDFTPFLAETLDQDQRLAVLTSLVRFCRRGAATRLDALPAEWTGLADLCTAASRAGLHPLRFDHFGNWYEDVAGLEWAAYLRSRPGALRETIRRRLRKAEALAGARFDLFVREDLDRAASAYEAVYQRSWKQAEPFPAFNTNLIRVMAQSGWLRLGLWSIDHAPVAAQFWAVRNGRAIILKLAHDEAAKAHSPGTTLTALMLRHLLNNEQIHQIDFGRGDDPYKQGWASQRRQRVGLLLVNPRHPAGLATLVRHAAGVAHRRLRARAVATP